MLTSPLTCLRHGAYIIHGGMDREVGIVLHLLVPDPLSKETHQRIGNTIAGHHPAFHIQRSLGGL